MVNNDLIPIHFEKEINPLQTINMDLPSVQLVSKGVETFGKPIQQMFLSEPSSSGVPTIFYSEPIS